MEGKTGYEILDLYFSAIIKKAKEEYKNKGIEPELVYVNVYDVNVNDYDNCRKKMYQYKLDNLYLYYDEDSFIGYISKEKLFDESGIKKSGVVYLKKDILEKSKTISGVGDNKIESYDLECINRKDKLNILLFYMSYVTGLKQINYTTYLPLVDLEQSSLVEEYKEKGMKYNIDIEAELKRVMDKTTNGTRIKTKYQEALELIQTIRMITKKEQLKAKYPNGTNLKQSIVKTEKSSNIPDLSGILLKKQENSEFKSIDELYDWFINYLVEFTISEKGEFLNRYRNKDGRLIKQYKINGLYIYYNPDTKEVEISYDKLYDIYNRAINRNKPVVKLVRKSVPDSNEKQIKLIGENPYDERYGLIDIWLGQKEKNLALYNYLGEGYGGNLFESDFIKNYYDMNITGLLKHARKISSDEKIKEQYEKAINLVEKIKSTVIDNLREFSDEELQKLSTEEIKRIIDVLVADNKEKTRIALEKEKAVEKKCAIDIFRLVNAAGREIEDRIRQAENLLVENKERG